MIEGAGALHFEGPDFGPSMARATMIQNTNLSEQATPLRFTR